MLLLPMFKSQINYASEGVLVGLLSVYYGLQRKQMSSNEKLPMISCDPGCWDLYLSVNTDFSSIKFPVLWPCN